MAHVAHLRCNHCGDLLTNRDWPYCPPCNLYLCYRAMPILLGMLFPLKLPQPQPVFARADAPGRWQSFADDEPCIMVAYSPRRALVSAYEEEPCIMVPY